VATTHEFYSEDSKLASKVLAGIRETTFIRNLVHIICPNQKACQRMILERIRVYLKIFH